MPPVEHWSWEHGSKITCLETWARKIEAEPPLKKLNLSSSFADWAAPRFFAPSFGAWFPVCTAFAAHPAQGLFNMELPRQYCLVNQPLLTWALRRTSCKFLLKRLCLSTKILSKQVVSSVIPFIATFSPDDSKQFCETLLQCLLWMKRSGHPGFGCLQIQYARTFLLGLAQSSWKIRENAVCCCCFFFAIICQEPKALVNKDLWQAIHKATVNR